MFLDECMMSMFVCIVNIQFAIELVCNSSAALSQYLRELCNMYSLHFLEKHDICSAVGFHYYRIYMILIFLISSYFT